MKRIGLLLLFALSGIPLLACSDAEEPVRPDPAGSERYGPWRLIAPGTEIEYRTDLPANDPDFNQVALRELALGSSLLLQPLAGFVEDSLNIARIDKEPVAITHLWTSSDGDLLVATQRYDRGDRPIDDIVRDDSGVTEVRTDEIDSNPAIIVVPAEGVSPGQGSVRVWVHGTELVVVSTTYTTEQLVSFAGEIVAQMEAARAGEA